MAGRVIIVIGASARGVSALAGLAAAPRGSLLPTTPGEAG